MHVQALQKENPERSIQMSYAILKACLSEQNSQSRTQALELISSKPDDAIEIFKTASSELAFQIRLIDRCLTRGRAPETGKPRDWGWGRNPPAPPR